MIGSVQSFLDIGYKHNDFYPDNLIVICWYFPDGSFSVILWLDCTIDMFGNTRKFATGFLLGGLLALAGFALQVAFGPVRWPSLAFPVSLVLMAAFVAVTVAMFVLRKKVKFFAWLGSMTSAVPALAWTLGFTVALGLIAQGAGRGWLGNMVTFWPFVLEYVWLTVVVGIVAVNHCRRIGRSWRDLAAVLNHLGLFLALTCATLGSADKHTLEMTVRNGETQTVAVDEDGGMVQTGIAVHLDKFTMETYPSGMPKRFASDVVVTGRSGQPVKGVIEVNKPMKVDGWRLYQYDYDEEAGPLSQISVLQMVRDPWLPLVYVGIFMMLAGAFLTMVIGARKEDEE